MHSHSRYSGILRLRLRMTEYVLKQYIPLKITASSAQSDGGQRPEMEKRTAETVR